ncbi:DegT/DnrJ/EryC1/StrS family aminotransferase [Kosakonia sp. H02]|nr:DegT/DnrJ/EryC1/StrS family aminotransferase [Kosakonia sp. H02]
MEFIDLGAQYKYLKSEIDSAINDVLRKGNYISGEQVSRLEHELSSYVGVKHSITCANGTDALTLALMAMGVKEGDAVFCPTFTFFATAEAIAFENATPVFVDSEEDSFNICPVDLESKIQKTISEGKLKPKVIISVDLFGLPANYDAINSIAEKYNLLVIEDAAQGFGGTFKTKKAGSFGHIATTSFFPAKPLGCYGDGGAIFTNNSEYATLIQSLRVHGKGNDKYDNINIGMNSRLDTIQAAILLEKIKVFPQELIARNKLAARYSKVLADKYKVPTIADGYYSSWAQYTICLEDREAVMAKCKEAGIPTMVYYVKCLHLQKAFHYLGYKEGNFPVAEKLSKQVLSLPMHPYMTEEVFAKIISAL